MLVVSMLTIIYLTQSRWNEFPPKKIVQDPVENLCLDDINHICWLFYSCKGHIVDFKYAITCDMCI